MTPTTVRTLSRQRRITFWTGWLSPQMEGISKEVFGLREHFPHSAVVGLSRHYTFKASLRRRYLGWNVKGYPILRLLAPFIETFTDINHVYGNLSEWFFLRALHHRPIVLTVAVAGTPLDPKLYRHVHRFIVHSTSGAQDLIRWGANPAYVRVLYPGIDLTRYASAPSHPHKRFRILFATAPDHADGFAKRGVNLLLDVARRVPDVDFHFIWRPWGTSSQLMQRLIEEHDLRNVSLRIGLVPDMASVFADADATIAPFLHGLDMKVCPTSLVESLACGRPVLVSTKVGIAELVQNNLCGEVAEPTAEDMCMAIERLRGRYASYAHNCHASAERYFSLNTCLRKHEELYEEVLTSTR